MKRVVLLLSLIGALSFLTGCGGQDTNKSENKGEEVVSQTESEKEEKEDASQTESEGLVVKDDLNREVTLEKGPENIAVLTPTLINLFYDVGGVATARMNVDSRSVIREEAMQIEEEVGALYNINIEKLVSLNPDLVIGQVTLHDDLVNILEDNGIPVVILEIRTYEQVIEKARLFSEIIGEEEKGEELIAEFEVKVENLRSNLPEQPKKVAIVYANQNEVTLETDKTTAGDVAKLLRIENVVTEEDLASDMLRIPFSMEELVERDPDMLLIVTYVGDIVDTLSADPAWSTIRAVEEGEVHVLPQHLFTSNPGFGLDKSIEFMRDTVYPEAKRNE